MIRRIEPAHLDLPARADAGASPDVGQKSVVSEQQLVKGRAAEVDEFAAVLQGLMSRRSGARGEKSLRALRAGFVTPSVSDPTILSGHRAIALLDRLLATILPQLPESAEFRVLARAVLGEE